MEDKIKLRPYQQKLYDEIKGAVGIHKKILGQAETGWGKSILIGKLAKITPSFSRCAIPNERSQKQKNQAKSYAAAVARLPPLVSHIDDAFPGAILPQSPLVPSRKSKRKKTKK